jgi:hypothetical protein
VAGAEARARAEVETKRRKTTLALAAALDFFDFHGFLRDAAGTIVPFDVPGSSSTIIIALNNAGAVGGQYVADNFSHGFLRGPDGSIVTLDGPADSQGGGGVTASNDSGQAAGSYYGPDGRNLGFIATPTAAVPEPSSLALIGAGMVVLGIGWRRRVAYRAKVLVTGSARVARGSATPGTQPRESSWSPATSRLGPVIPTLLACFASALWPARAAADPIVPGFLVATYASVPDPIRLSFDPSVIIYVGNGDNSPGGAPIYRVGLGGSSVNPYGSARFDPDAVLFDVAGVISGVPGAVLVGGNSRGTSQGLITAIRPDQTSFNLFGPTVDFRNPNDMVIDKIGRLLFTDNGDGAPTKQAVFVSTGGTPTALFVEAGGAIPDAIAIDAGNRIFTAGSDGVIRVHDASGVLVDGAFASGLGAYPAIGFGRGGAFGTDLYALDSVAGILLRFDDAGYSTVVGTGFDPDSTAMDFGPDQALYVSQRDHDRILRIAPVPEPSSAVSMTLGMLGLLTLGRRLWRQAM